MIQKKILMYVKQEIKPPQWDRVARWYRYFKTKNPNLGTFLEGLPMENVGVCMAIWYI
jgi:hypothetical protein